MNEYGSIDIRPYQLMCVICRLGAQDGEPYCHAERLDEILAAVRGRRWLPLTLRCNVQPLYSFQNCGTEYDTPEGELFNCRRDLTILQKLGLVPGATRPGFELFSRIIEKVNSTRGICGFGDATSDTWRGCTLADSGNYERGRDKGIDAVIPPHPAAETAACKQDSCTDMYRAEGLKIRPHHLMCMTCFHKGQAALAPIEEDNLFEAVDIIQKHPEIPVTLVPGCCMICPPCPLFDPGTGWCIGRNAMALRDEKKDLDVLQLLGLEYGDTLPARELYARLYECVQSTTQVCGYGDGQTSSYEWTVCNGSDGSEGYVKGRRAGLGLEGNSGPLTR